MVFGIDDMLIGGAAVGLAGGIGNFFANQSASNRAEALQNQALQNWLSVNVPDPRDQQVILQRFVETGQMDPVLEQAFQATPSAMEKVQMDPAYKAEQQRSLAALSDIANKGGLRLSDRAALNDAMLDSATRARGDREAILQDMDARGQGGSGARLAADLMSSQASADRNARSSMDVAAKAQDRALQAIMSSGELAGKIGSQDFDQQAQRATAADRINMFNTQNMQSVAQRNAAAQNAAQLEDLRYARDIGMKNTDLSNKEQMYNKGLAQQYFDNQSKKAAGMSGQYANMAGTAMQQGQNMGNMFSNTASGIGGAMSAAAQNNLWKDYFNSQKRNRSQGVNFDV